MAANTTVSVKQAPFNAAGDGVTDDSAAIQAAINSSSTGEILVLFPAGIYKVTQTITITNDRVRLVGDGKWVTRVLFVPSTTTGHQILFDFGKTAATTIVQCSVEKMSIYSTNTTTQKSAIRITDASDMLIEEVVIGVGGTEWTGNSSRALNVRGHEMVTVRKISIVADFPIYLDQNPNYTHQYAADHFHFQDTILLAPPTTGTACIYVADGASVTDLVVDGYNTWTGGQWGLYWHTTTNIGFDDKLTLRNIRHEGPFASSSRTIDISHNYGLRNVLVEQVTSSTANGFSFRGVARLTMLSNQYLGSGMALDIANASMELINNFFLGGSTVSTSGMTRVTAIARPSDSTEPDWDIEVWEPSSNTNLGAGQAQSLNGVNRYAATGSLSNGSLVSVPFGGGSGRCGIIQVFAKNSASTAQAGMTVLITTNNALLIGGTPSAEVTVAPAGPSAGKLTVHSYANSASIALVNNLGSTVDYGYTVDWI